MKARDHEHAVVVVDSKEDAIREPSDQGTARVAVNDGKLPWILHDNSQRRAKRFDEPLAQPAFPRLVPAVGSIDVIRGGGAEAEIGHL